MSKKEEIKLGVEGTGVFSMDMDFSSGGSETEPETAKLKEKVKTELPQETWGAASSAKAQETQSPEVRSASEHGRKLVIEQLSVSSKESIRESLAEPTVEKTRRCHSFRQ